MRKPKGKLVALLAGAVVVVSADVSARDFLGARSGSCEPELLRA